MRRTSVFFHDDVASFGFPAVNGAKLIATGLRIEQAHIGSNQQAAPSVMTDWRLVSLTYTSFRMSFPGLQDSFEVQRL